MSGTTPLRPAAIRGRLLRWYDRVRRDLPWRRSHDPYAIWLSEIMLQQTQVATVIPYYQRFLKRFPTVKSLADAPLRDVLKLWAGLGYYARARNLHATAREIRTRFAGRFPQDMPSLRSLPGVGRYTAGAIASIAFGQREAVVDGNVARVLSRLFNVTTDVAAGFGHRRVWQLAEALVPDRQCGDFNQALMELGATVCLPGAEACCEVCPLSSLCEARRRGVVSRRPLSRRRAKVRHETHVVAAVQSGDKVLVRRRPMVGLWGGLWELPSEPMNGTSESTQARRLAESLVGKVRLRGNRSACDMTRVLSHRKIRFVGYAFMKAKASKPFRANVRWVRLEEASQLGMSKAMSEVVASLRIAR